VRPKSIEVYWVHAVVAVVDQPGGGFALVQRHADGVEDELAAQVIGHRPPDDPPSAGIDDHGEVEEALPRAQVGDVGNPQLVGLLGDELPLDQIRRHRASGETGTLLAVAAPVDVLDPGHSHESGDLLTVPALAAVTNLSSQPASTVGAAVFGPRVMQQVRRMGVVEVGMGDDGAAAAIQS
jgi:hypothetical protein